MEGLEKLPMKRQKSAEEIALEDIKADVQEMQRSISQAEEEEKQINNRAEIAGGDRRGRRPLKKIFGDVVLGNPYAEQFFRGWASKVNVPLPITGTQKVDKRRITDKVMKDFIESLNEEDIQNAGLSEADVSLLRGKSQAIESQRKVMPSLLGLVAQKGASVDIMPDPSFGVNKSVAQKSQGTDLNLMEYARATGMDTYEKMSLIGAGQKSMVAPKEIEEEEKKVDERLRREVRVGGGPALDIIKNSEARISEGMFGDNMIREINAGLTGLEQNPNIEVVYRPGIKEVRFKNILDEPEEKKYPAPAGSILRQDAMLHGPDDQLPHADPNDDRELMNIGARRLAENNQYTGDQKDFMSRIDANKDIRGRIERGNIDAMLGSNPPQNVGDKRGGEEQKYGEEEKYEQEGIGGGMGDDEGEDLEDLTVREGGQKMREIIENEIQKRMLQPRGQWAGNRGGNSDWTRPFEADKIAESVRSSQQLAYLRNTGIPYKMPSRSYANNSVGLIRNSNRSMILAVNQLEP